MTAETAKKIYELDLHLPGISGPCPGCGKGTYHGSIFKTCDNPDCELYDKFAFEICPVCKEQRRHCKCQGDNS